MDGERSFDSFRMPDAMWEAMAPLLPVYEKSGAGGRPRADLRSIADAIFYRMRTGCQWKAIPPQLAAGSTAHAYFQDWVARGIFRRLWELALDFYDKEVGLDWNWQSIDGAMTKAPLGGEMTGKNPTDRGKLGTKRSLMTDAAGIPTGLTVAGANVHDIRLLQDTIEDCFQRFYCEQANDGERICLDKGYDSAAVRELLEAVYGYETHVRSRSQELEGKKKKRIRARRWVVERTHSWFNRFRAILIRWEKKTENHLAALHLACAYITFRRLTVFG